MYVCVDIFKHIIFIIYIYIYLYIFYIIHYYSISWFGVYHLAHQVVSWLSGLAKRMMSPGWWENLQPPWFLGGENPGFLQISPKKNDPSIFKKLRRCQYQISDKKTQNSVIFGWNSHRWWQKSPKTNPLLQSGHLGCSSKSFLRRSRRSSGAVYLGILKSWGAPSHHRF